MTYRTLYPLVDDGTFDSRFDHDVFTTTAVIEDEPGIDEDPCAGPAWAERDEDEDIDDDPDTDDDDFDDDEEEEEDDDWDEDEDWEDDFDDDVDDDDDDDTDDDLDAPDID